MFRTMPEPRPADRVIDVPPPEAYPHCGERSAVVERVDQQVQRDIEVRTIVRRFQIRVARCPGCGRRRRLKAHGHRGAGAAAPDGIYSNAKDSIAKTGGPHNAFLAGSVTFTLDVPDVTTDTTIESGTTPGDNVPLHLPASAVGGLLLTGSLWAARKIRQA